MLVRADGIGDALVCAPLIAALRDAGHPLGAVLGARNATVFAPATFEQVHVLERIPWPAHGSTPDSRAVALREARAARYDAALVVSEEVEAYAFARDAGIRRRIGFVNGWEKPLKTLHVGALLSRRLVRPASARRAREHEVETLFRLGAGFYAEPVPTRDPARLRPLLFEHPVERHGRVVVQLSAKLAACGLDLEAYVALVRALGAYETFVVADDRAFAAQMRRASGCDLELPPTLEAWKGRLAGAAAVVTPDSGAAHVAGMCGVPCVDLFAGGPTFDAEVRRWHPWAAPYRALPLRVGEDPAALATRVRTALAAVLATESP